MSDPSLRWAEDGSAVICADCIEWVAVDRLYVDPTGQKWDTCVPCGERHEVALVLLWMSQGRNNRTAASGSRDGEP